MNKFLLPVDQEITLRLLDESDAPLFYELIIQNQDFFKKWLSWATGTYTLQDALDKIIKDQERFKKGESLEFGIFYNEIFVGRVGFHEINKRSAEIGYLLSEQYNGKGIMTRSAKKITEYGLIELDKHRIVIKMDVENIPSKSIPQKLGFTYEGTERESGFSVDNQWRSSEVWSFIKGDTFLI